MNLGLNKVEGTLVHDALTYFFKSTQCPKALLECYPGADLADIMNQLQYIMLLIGEYHYILLKRTKKRPYIVFCATKTGA